MQPILITGNHDVLSKVGSHFDEVFAGPLFIADRILLSHEPIFGMEEFCVNIHGHVHGEKGIERKGHVNLASDVCGYSIFNLGVEINRGLISKTANYHRLTIDKATEKPMCKKTTEFLKYAINLIDKSNKSRYILKNKESFDSNLFNFS